MPFLAAIKDSLRDLHGAGNFVDFLRKYEIGILQMERSIVRSMSSVQLKDRKSRAKSKMLMLGLNETIDHSAMANCALIW